MIATALSTAETQLLSVLGCNRLVYEAGALLGASTVALAAQARFVVSVDPHSGYPHDRPRPTWVRYLANLERHGVRDRVQPVRASFLDALPAAAYDLAFADLTGDFELTWLFLRHTMHVPIVAVHDYSRSGCEGATRAIDHFIWATRPRSIERVDSLIVLTR